MLGTISYIKGCLMSSSQTGANYSNDNFYPGNPDLKPSETLDLGPTIPDMTSNTSPEGKCDGSALRASDDYWKAFSSKYKVIRSANDTALTVTYDYAKVQRAGTYVFQFYPKIDWYENIPKELSVSLRNTSGTYKTIWSIAKANMANGLTTSPELTVDFEFNSIKVYGSQQKYSVEVGFGSIQLTKIK